MKPERLVVPILLAAALCGAAAEESRRPSAPVPPTPEARAREAIFYSDMGPDEIDVSAYPIERRREYAIYSAACSRCHSLARSINAPLVGRGWWEFYLMGMRARGRLAGRPFTKEETAAILDFLEYDSRVRKVERAREFDALTDELKERFGKSIAERLRALQNGRTRVLRPPDR